MDKYSASLDRAFYALADPTRRAVLRRLGQGEATVSDLAMPFAMALPSFMKHLRVLEASGLIGSKKSGRVRTCTLNARKLAAIEEWFLQQRAAWERRHQNLNDLLARQKEKNHDSKTTV